MSLNFSRADQADVLLIGEFPIFLEDFKSAWLTRNSERIPRSSLEGNLQSAALKKILIQTDYDIILAPFDFLVGYFLTTFW